MERVNITNSSQISRLVGTTPEEVFIVTFFVPICSLALELISTILAFPPRCTSYFEMVALNLVLLLALTLLSNYLLSLIVILGTASFAAFCIAISSLTLKEINSALSMKKCLLSSFPLFVLGFARLAATSAVRYHKAVLEYGMHWNFFFTLAFTKVICYGFLSKIKINTLMLAVATLIFHQLLLSKAGFSSLVLSDHRRNFLEANKEGICSLLGFVSLYFCGVQMGHMIWTHGHKVSDYVHLLLKLCGVGLCGWLLMYIIHGTIQPVSRRMANLSYCVWVVSLTSLQFAIHLCYHLIVIIFNELFTTKGRVILLWEVVNSNGLFYFLLANILTGLINLTINTNDSSDVKSLLILVIYLTILSVFALILHKSKKKNSIS